MKKPLLMTATLLVPASASAMQTPDSLAICYLFKGDSSTAEPCVVSYGDTGKGHLTALRFGGKTYVQEDWWEGDKAMITLNDKPATHYLREAIFFQVTTNEEAEELGWEHLLYCMKSSDVDVCYFRPQQ